MCHLAPRSWLACSTSRRHTRTPHRWLQTCDCSGSWGSWKTASDTAHLSSTMHYCPRRRHFSSSISSDRPYCPLQPARAASAAIRALSSTFVWPCGSQWTSEAPRWTWWCLACQLCSCTGLRFAFWRAQRGSHRYFQTLLCLRSDCSPLTDWTFSRASSTPFCVFPSPYEPLLARLLKASQWRLLGTARLALAGQSIPGPAPAGVTPLQPASTLQASQKRCRFFEQVVPIVNHLHH